MERALLFGAIATGVMLLFTGHVVAVAMTFATVGYWLGWADHHAEDAP